MKLSLITIPALVTVIAIGCSSSSTTSPQTTNDAGSKDSGSSGGGDSGSDMTADSGGATDAGGGGTDSGGKMPVIDTDGGCVTEQSASMLCGTMSDDSVCKLSVMCGHSSDDGQCKINCEMGATVSCFTTTDAQCLLDAVKSQMCTDIKACKWIL
jgi:hypothetical protein